MKIGIIGQGFVGSAIREGLKNFYEISTFDLDQSKSTHSHKEVVLGSDIIFICVPMPMKKSGECDVSIVLDCVKSINTVLLECQITDQKIVVIKSTVPPGTTQKINDNLCTDNLTAVFSPEFLTEANSFEDFKNQTRIIIGGPRPATGNVKTMFRKVFPRVPIIKTGSEVAEMVKYFTNCFLATKVIFANEMSQICQELHDVDFDKVIEYALYDNRIGPTHLAVPGPDGDFGFGGHCFPKDMAALLFFANQNGVNADMLQAAWEKNMQIRSDLDWLRMKGRAVTDEE